MRAMRAFAGIFVTIFLLVFGAGAFGAATFAMVKRDEGKRAVIILPGLFASGLYDTATGNGVWDPLESLDISFGDLSGADGLNMEGILPLIFEPLVIDELTKILENEGMGATDSLFNLIAMNEDGTPAVSTVQPVPFTSESRLRYGVVNAQKDMYEYLEAQYGEDNDVVIFNYDFRLDNRDSAEKLEEYVNAKGYEEIILVSHSNGGEVAAGYLARSEANRDKVKKYISYNSPYYGSFSAIDILEDIDGMVAGMTGIASEFLPNKLDTIENIVNHQALKLLNMWPVYQLLPSYELLSQEYGGEQAGYYIDGQVIDFGSQEELWEFYCSRPWAKTSSGELRIQMQEWLEYRDSLTVTLANGDKVLSTTLVDTTYFTGDRNLGSYKTYFRSADDGLNYLGSAWTDMGDGIVLYGSAVGFTTDASRIVVFMEKDHYGVVTDYAGIAAAATKDAIDLYLSTREATWYQEMWEILLGEK